MDCCICGGKGEYWGTRYGLDYVKCKCGLIYCDPAPTPEALAAYYSSSYFDDNHYDDDPQRKEMYDIEIRELVLFKRSGKFLDVGCAVGRFLEALPDRFTKAGVEYSEHAAKIGRQRGLMIFTGELNKVDLPNRYFDMVQWRGSLEHSQSPYDDLVRSRTILKDDGILKICQLPNIGGLCGKLYKTRFNQFKPGGEHLYFFTPDTITKLLNKAGFKVLQMSFPYLGTPYASPVKDMARFFINLATGKENPAFWGNMISLYAAKT